MHHIKALQKIQGKINRDIKDITEKKTEKKTVKTIASNHEVCQSCQTVDLDPAFMRSQRCLSGNYNSIELESYKTLRTRVHQIMMAHQWNTLMVTSACAGEGKSLTAINLALTFAQHYDHTVLLVDCDLRKQNIHKYLGYSSYYNIIDHLIDNVQLHKIMMRPGKEKIVFISGERTIESANELLGSAQMSSLVKELKNRYKDRIIIFDAPPVLFASDALVSASWVDCMLMVVQYGKTSLKDVQKSLEGFPKDKLIGIAMNRRKINKKEYYRYGNYSYNRR